MALLSLAALSLISSPSFVCINLLTLFSTSDAVTNAFLSDQSFTTKPTFRTSVIRVAFLGWSECMGHVAIGTPMVMLSKHEFHPQWLINPPVERWLRISNWGAQS
ncbi:hypothetical protein V8G54_028182, partial [Vigna mungo]